MTKNLRVGVFLIGGAALFGVGLFLIGDRKQAFARHFEVYTEFASLSGLQSGAKVRVSGMDAGEVSEMHVPKRPSARFRLKLRLDQKLRPLVRQDSVALIQTEGLVGNKFLEIEKGSDRAPECPAGCTLPSREPFDFSDLMQQGNDLLKATRAGIDDVRQNADRAIQAFASVGGHADEAILSMRGDLKRITVTGTRITDDMGEIMAGIRAGHGAAGRLLSDEQVARNIDETAARASQASANLEQATTNVNDILADFEERDLLGRAESTLENARQMTDKLNQAVTTFLANTEGGQNAALNLRETLTSARQTMSNLADDTEALKHNFLLRGFFKRRGYYNLDRLTPEQYRVSKFVLDPGAKRAWVQGTGLFSVRPDGGEDLSPEGQLQVDQAVAPLIENLPNNPIMVEGYSAEGSPEQRYVASRQHAVTVKRYLEKRFQVNPKLVGIMPLSGQSPTGKSVQDGISLVLLPGTVKARNPRPSRP